MKQLTPPALTQPRIAIDLEQFDGPKAFDRKLIRKLARPKHAVEHLKGALKRQKACTDAEHRSLILLALTEIGVAHGLLPERDAKSVTE